MNKGIKVAKGEYLQFLNSGDSLISNLILNQIFQSEHTADILYGDCLFSNNNGNKTPFTFTLPDKITLNLFINQSICHPASFIRKELLQEEAYDETLQIVSDWKFFLRKTLSGATFQHIPFPISIFDTNGISSTNTNLAQHERELVIKKEVPQCCIFDYEELNKLIEYKRNIENDWQIAALLKIKGKRKSYHKIITTAIRLIQSIELLFPSK